MERHIPRVKVVYEKFHVVQLANRALEEIRRLERPGGSLTRPAALADGRRGSVSGAGRVRGVACPEASEDGAGVHDRGDASGHSLESISVAHRGGGGSAEIVGLEPALPSGVQTEGSQPVLSNLTVPNIHVSFTSRR